MSAWWEQFQRKFNTENTATIYLMHGRINQMLSRHSRNFLHPRLPSYLFIYCLHIQKTWNLNILIDNECSETMRQWRRNNHVSNKALWPQKYFPETHNIYCWYPFSLRHIALFISICIAGNYEENPLCLVYLASVFVESLHSISYIISHFHIIEL